MPSGIGLLLFGEKSGEITDSVREGKTKWAHVETEPEYKVMGDVG